MHRTHRAEQAIVICDKPDLLLFPVRVFEKLNLERIHVKSMTDAHQTIASHPMALIILSMAIGGVSSHRLLETILAQHPDALTIIISTNDQIDDAAEALRIGASDCLFLPFTPERLHRTIVNLLDTQNPTPGTTKGSVKEAHQSESSPSQSTQSLLDKQLQMMATSAPMHEVSRALKALPFETSPLLISGETGSGKETLARIIHQLDPTRSGEFVKVDCSLLTQSGLKRHFYGADAITDPLSHPTWSGVLNRAKNGTLYLDHIDYLDPGTHHQVTQILAPCINQTDENERQERNNIRIISSSFAHQDQLISSNTLDHHLLFNLCVIALHIPPLRARKEEITDLIFHKFHELNGKASHGFDTLSDQAAQVMRHYDWPGNLRQLHNTIRQIALIHEGPTLEAHMLPHHILEHSKSDTTADPLDDMINTRLSGLVGHRLCDIERVLIEKTIEAEGGSLPRAARKLGVSASTLYRKRENWNR